MELLEEFWSLGFQTIVVSVNGNLLDKSFCGRILDKDFVNDLPPISTLAVKMENFIHSFLKHPILVKKLSLR
jgi:diphthamide synthase (EF-2-diphthine--ammonia ligase)